ncbi:MAG: hypothetical protein ABIP94_17875, partial [Planctomycetota bacterium]
MTVNTLGIYDQDRSSRTVAEWLWPLLPIGLSVFCLAALVYYRLYYGVLEVRSAMQVLIATIYGTVGFAPAVLCFLLVLTWSSIWFATGKLERPVSRVLRLLAMTVMLGVFLNLGDGDVTAAAHKGELGAWLAGRLVAAIGYPASLVLVWVVTFASLLLATDFFFSESFERLRSRQARPESGVEVAVTDHLRGLGTAAVPLPTARVAPGQSIGAAPGPELAGSSAAGSSEAGATVVEGQVSEQGAADEEPVEAGRYTRRRPYYERQRDRDLEPPEDVPAVAPEEAEEAEEGNEWVPTAPDSQEIDNPESRPSLGARRGEVEGPVDVDVEVEAANDVDADASRVPSPAFDVPAASSAGAPEAADDFGHGVDEVFAPPSVAPTERQAIEFVEPNETPEALSGVAAARSWRAADEAVGEAVHEQAEDEGDEERT